MIDVLLRQLGEIEEFSKGKAGRELRGSHYFQADSVEPFGRLSSGYRASGAFRYVF